MKRVLLGLLLALALVAFAGVTTGAQSAPATNAREQAFANGSTGVPIGVWAPIPWQHISGSKLLNYADPAHPTVTTAGIYAVTASIHTTDGPQPSGAIAIQIVLDANNEAASTRGFAPADVDPTASPAATASLTYYMPAGGAIEVDAYNSTPNGPLNFAGISMVVQKIS